MDIRIGYRDLASFADGPMKRAGEAGRFSVSVFFRFEADMTPLFPYINAVADRAELFERPPMVRFVFKEVYCAVYADHCVASPLESLDHSRAFAEELVAYLADIRDRQAEIVPRAAPFKSGNVPEILKLLPGTNCGTCGFKTCLAFAAMLARQQANPAQCPHMTQPAALTFELLDEGGYPVSQVTLHTGSRAISTPPSQARDVRTVRPEDLPKLPGGALTGREIEVLALMAEGWTNPEISDRLDISPHTVKSHVIHIFNKLGVNHRTQAVVWAVRNRII